MGDQTTLPGELSTSAVDCDEVEGVCFVFFGGQAVARVIPRRAWPNSSATMTKSVWPRMSVVARV